MGVMHRGRPAPGRPPGRFLFAGLAFRPGRNALAGEDGSTVELTTSEARLLSHFLSKPWTLCTRSEIGEFLYGDKHTVGDRALDVIVDRLRQKISSRGGPAAEQLIKTEFRRGYLLLCDVATVPHSSRGPHPALATVV
jgi:two-component system OmpR family response regulator